MSLRSIAIAFLLSAVALPALAAESAPVGLTPFTATYTAKYNGIGVIAVRELSGQNGNWRLDFNADSFFADIHEYSRFGSDGNKLAPQHYEYHRTGLGRDKHQVLNFEPDQRRVVDVSDAKHTIENAPRDIHDKITYQLQLALDIAAGREPLEYQVASGKKIREYKFAIAGKEALQTPLGPVETIRVQRVRDGDSERETDIWFAPQWDYALVKLVQQEDGGKHYQINLTKLVIGGKAVGSHQ